MFRLPAWLWVLFTAAVWIAVPSFALSQGNPVEDRKILQLKSQEEYRLYFKEPKTPLEFWIATEIEIDFGKFDVAFFHLDKLLKLEPKANVDTELLKIEAEKGMDAFLRLKNIRNWHPTPELNKEANDNVMTLIDRVTQALKQKLSDPVRLDKMIRQLSAATVEERAYAFQQLSRSKGHVAPYLVEHLKRTAGKAENLRIKDAMLRLDAEILPPLLEVLKAASPQDANDAENNEVRLTIMDLFRKRKNDTIVPYLWHLGSSPAYPEYVRKYAREALADFLRQDISQLPDARLVLTQMAEDLYKHQYKFPYSKRELDKDGKILLAKIPFWAWDGQKVSVTVKDMSLSEAEYFFGVRYAQEVLDLDPGYKPAQELFLSLILERQFKDKLDQFLINSANPLLEFTPPKDVLADDLHKLLASVDSHLLIQVLDRALADHNAPVVLPLLRILGERGEVRALRLSENGGLQGILKAMYYPDQRVQIGAVRAALQMPIEVPSALKSRILEILKRALATAVLPEARDPAALPKAVVFGVPDDEKVIVWQTVKAVGLEPVRASTIKEAFAVLHQVADVDVILVHPLAPPDQLPFFLAQVRADVNVGLVPVLLLAPLDRHDSLKVQAARYRNISVLSSSLLQPASAMDLKAEIASAIQLANAPDFAVKLPVNRREQLFDELRQTAGLAYTPTERKLYASEALFYLWKMAKGEIKGFDLLPVKSALMDATHTKDMAEPAIEALSKIPGEDVQKRLADLVINSAEPKVQYLAASALNQHVLRNGLVLNTFQTEPLSALARNAKTDPALRNQLIILMGRVPASPSASGIQLRQFQP